MIPLIILLIVFVLIAVRQIGNVRLQIWQIMFLGAIAVLITGQISPQNALGSIDLDVMLFLFGMFVIGQALEESGYLSHLSYKLFRRARSLDSLVLYILFGAGMLSAFLMNDTLAIIGTPVVLILARKAGVQSKILLLTLAFAVTIGSVMSPIGNPQNLLIAINGNITNPFVTFMKYLSLPTMLNLFLAYLLLKLFYRRHFRSVLLTDSPEPIADRKLALLSKISLALMLSLVVAKIVLVCTGLQIDFRLTYIALVSALPVILLSRKRLGIIRRIDWYTLVFFTSMFILMQSVWNSEVFQSMVGSMDLDLDSVGVIMAASVLLSQLISNVPLVALYLPMLVHLGAPIKSMMALAAGSTIAGNLTILGAASNVIIIQNAERKSGETITFLEFVKIGLPLTIVNILAYYLFLSFI
jgi:Na+/H+ antiporter NhaD/arsenite permease-like protein